jgi:hypothetical protein
MLICLLIFCRIKFIWLKILLWVLKLYIIKLSVWFSIIWLIKLILCWFNLLRWWCNLEVVDRLIIWLLILYRIIWIQIFQLILFLMFMIKKNIMEFLKKCLIFYSWLVRFEFIVVKFKNIWRKILFHVNLNLK